MMGNCRVRPTFCVSCTLSLYHKSLDVLFSHLLHLVEKRKRTCCCNTVLQYIALFSLLLFFFCLTTFFFSITLISFPRFPSSLHFYFFPCLRSWKVVLLPSSAQHLCAGISCQLRTTLCESDSHSFHLLDLSLVLITLKSGYRDLCWICRWHRFKATSREPAGCFTLQINLTTRGIIVQGRRAGAWTPSWALCCLVIYHNLTTLVLMLLPSGDEGFLFHSGHPSACDIDCCHIIL